MAQVTSEDLVRIIGEQHIEAWSLRQENAKLMTLLLERSAQSKDNSDQTGGGDERSGSGG